MSDASCIWLKRDGIAVCSKVSQPRSLYIMITNRATMSSCVTPSKTRAFRSALIAVAGLGPMKHCVDLTGDYKTTIYAAARRLLACGANPADTIETWRGGKLSMSGVIGECAKWTVKE